ncbi:MAG: membrane protein insertion efficiency factor YidD [bacterium]|nr:membrane protein insertion efficiency factor YidD [bacterium]
MTYGAILVRLIRAYQLLVSPFFPPTCRYYPSCSEYAIQAIGYYGPLWGLAKAAWRLLRCNPLSRGGVDLPISVGDSV